MTPTAGNLREMVGDFQKDSLFNILSKIVEICGIDSVLLALRDISATKYSVTFPEGTRVIGIDFAHPENTSFYVIPPDKPTN